MSHTKSTSILIRRGAAHEDVTIDGTKFDLSTMDKPTRSRFLNLMIGGLKRAGKLVK